MTTANVTLTVREATSRVKVIDITGEITSFSEKEISAAHEEASRGGVDAVVLNFEGLDYMNSGGIGLLVTTLIRARRSGHRLMAYGLTDHASQIFSTRPSRSSTTKHRRSARCDRVSARWQRKGHRSLASDGIAAQKIRS